MIWLFISLIVIAAISNAVMDVLQFKFSNSIFSKFKNQNWWNPKLSWANKWKNGDPLQGENFWGSSRWFVRFTDAWYFFQGLMFTSLFFSIIYYTTIFSKFVDFIGIYLIFTIIFEIFYSKIFCLKQ